MATDAASAPVLERPDLRVGIRSALDSGSLLLIADEPMPEAGATSPGDNFGGR